MINTKKRTVIVNKRRFFTFIIIAIVLANVLFMYAYLPKNTQADAAEKTLSITVCAGDTIWSIAEEHGSDDEDVRNTVYKIKKLNDMQGSDLKVGQQILVPIV